MTNRPASQLSPFAHAEVVIRGLDAFMPGAAHETLALLKRCSEQTWQDTFAGFEQPYSAFARPLVLDEFERRVKVAAALPAAEVRADRDCIQDLAAVFPDAKEWHEAEKGCKA